MTAPLCSSLHSQVTIVGYRKSSIKPLGGEGGAGLFISNTFGGSLIMTGADFRGGARSFIVVSDFIQSIIY